MVSRFQDDPLTGYLAALAKAPVDDDTRRYCPPPKTANAPSTASRATAEPRRQRLTPTAGFPAWSLLQVRK